MKNCISQITRKTIPFIVLAHLMITHGPCKTSPHYHSRFWQRNNTGFLRRIDNAFRVHSPLRFFRQTERFSKSICCIKRRSTERRRRVFCRNTNASENDRELQVVAYGRVKICLTTSSTSRINDDNVTIVLCVE